ncbi:MAG: hypothetical protein ACU836_16390 [Gammaproteobacteria bacterium]
MTWEERIDTRTATLFASLQTALPARVCKRSLMHFTQHAKGEIGQGVVMMISDSESDYSNIPRRTATEGKHSLILVGHLQVAETASHLDIELAEMAMMEEIKGWLRAGVPNMRLQLNDIRQSRQLDHPYGWIAAKFTASPMRITNNVK